MEVGCSPEVRPGGMCNSIDADDPLVLGQHVVAILKTGHRDAKHKLATLMGLIERCIDNPPPAPRIGRQ